MWSRVCFWLLTFAFTFVVSALKLAGLLAIESHVSVLLPPCYKSLLAWRCQEECLRWKGPLGHQSCHPHLTNETQRGEGTCPRTHSRSAVELGLEPSPPDSPLGSFALSQEAWPHSGQRLFWAPGLVVSQHLSFSSSFTESCSSPAWTAQPSVAMCFSPFSWIEHLVPRPSLLGPLAPQRNRPFVWFSLLQTVLPLADSCRTLPRDSLLVSLLTLPSAPSCWWALTFYPCCLLGPSNLESPHSLLP